MAPAAELQRQFNATMRAQAGYLDQIRASLSYASTLAAAAWSNPMKEVRDVLDMHREEMRRISKFDALFRDFRKVNSEVERLLTVRDWHEEFVLQSQAQIASLLAQPAELDLLVQATTPFDSHAIDDGQGQQTSIESPNGTADNPLTASAALSELSASIGETRTLYELLSVLLGYAARYGSLAGLFALALLREILVNWAASQLPTVDTLLTYTGLSRREATKEVQKTAQTVLTDGQRERLRFVASPSLDAHVSPKLKSRKQARLPFGCIVSVTGKSGDWFYVTYRDPLTKEESEGWLLARYVQRFDK